MLEYFTNKTTKKHHPAEERKPSKSPVLSPKDEQFLQQIVAEEGLADGPPPKDKQFLQQVEAEEGLSTAMTDGPPIGEASHSVEDQEPVIQQNQQERGVTAERNVEGDDAKETGKKEEKDSHKAANRWSFLQKITPKKFTSATTNADQHNKLNEKVTPKEAAKDEEDLTVVLDKLNLAAEDNRVFSLSKESRDLVQRFNVILKDLVNGVPTAYDDLVQLLESSQSHLEKSYRGLPSYLQKLVRTLPKKMTTSLAPELLATAAEAQGLSKKQADTMGATAKKSGLRMPSLKDMVTKPGGVATLLRAIMNSLKLRWPAFMGTSVLWSLGIFMLLLVLWYCHKRGREVRLAKEQHDMLGIKDEDRFEELDDDDTSDAEPSTASSKKLGGPAHHGSDKPGEKIEL